MVKSPYKELEKYFRRIGALNEVLGILNWDMAVVMPSGAAENRARQIAEINLIIHEILNEPEIKDLLAEAESIPISDKLMKANLAEMKRMYVHSTAMDASLVSALTETSTNCEMCWREARSENNFSGIKKNFEYLLSLVREKGACKADALDCSPYDSLINEFEPGIKQSEIDILFDDLLRILPDIYHRTLERQKRVPSPVHPKGPFSIESQRKLGVQMMKRLGFDFDHGRLDVSLHPFCGGSPGDIRITTRYYEDDFTQGLMGVMHETGHALYESNLPKKWRLQPVGQARGMTIHESQSLLIEMQICRSTEFIVFAAPLMRAAFGGHESLWEVDNIASLTRRVIPNYIRVDADEVTYPFHVILRYELEKALIKGDLLVSDIPSAWNSGIKDFLGITPPDDGKGCLQDIHWFSGAFGYFPTYTLGALAAAQMAATIRHQNPDAQELISKGDFKVFTDWCARNIHAKASFLGTNDILVEATGHSLGTSDFHKHLESRYLA